MAEPLGHLRRLDPHLELLHCRDRAHDITHRMEDARDRKRHRRRLEQQLAAREIDDVVSHRAQSQRRGADQSQLFALHIVDSAALQRLSEKENRCQRRAHVVGDIGEQVQAIATAKLRRKGMDVAVRDRVPHALNGQQQHRQLGLVDRVIAPTPHDLIAHELEQPAAEL